MKILDMRQWDGLWPLLAGLALGILIAFPLAAPLFGGKILEPAATLWGSALGALAAVSGSTWVANRASQAQRRNAASLVLAVIHPTIFALTELILLYGQPSARTDHSENDNEPDVLLPERWGEIRHVIYDLIFEYDSLKTKLRRIESAMNSLGPQELDCLFKIEDELEDMMGNTISRLQAQSMEPGLALYPGPASWNSRHLINSHFNYIHERVARLTVAAR